MQLATAAMNTALRVRMAIEHHSHPAPGDVAELRRMAPLFATAPIHEFAMEVIRQAAKRHAMVVAARGRIT